MHRRGVGRGSVPPVEAPSADSWRMNCESAPSKAVVPNLPREGATRQEDLHGLDLLVAEQAEGRVGKTMESKARGGPASVRER